MYIGSKEFRIPERVSRGLVVAVAAAVISALSAGYFAFKASSAESARAVSDEKLAHANAELDKSTKALAAADSAAKSKIDKAKEEADRELSALREQVAAFAKQAAACEVLRKKIGR